jgi:acyl carrier protein
MGNKSIKNRLKQVMADVLNIKPSEIKDGTTADDVEDWDSLAHVDLIIAVETEFNIKFTLNEIPKATSFPEILKIVETKF